ncbi:ATP-dependent DNA ligase I [Trachipleistophora hominis]|uniref:ATP-dependent DNA ligase I n=1 Tax=Trachipleistophora hominis TaxID=72359 RepID=L7JZG2_TRAHO|nr:ATP-dependent DNA ligase I [Trachipleistophora hominis]
MPTLFKDLCSVFKEIEEKSGRLEIQQILSNYLSTLDKENMIIAFYLCTGTVYPTYENKELNIGEGILYKVIGDMTGKNIKVLKKEYAEYGDLGQIACKYKINKLIKVEKSFELNEIYNGLKKIGEIEGKDAMFRKKNAILKMLSVMSPNEIKYFVRLLEGKLKIGLAIQTVLISIGMVFENKEDSLDLLKKAYDRCASVEILLDKIYKDGIQSLDLLEIVPLIPFRAMLCNPLNSFTVNFSDFICEVKYDGERIQIHKKNDQVKFYSRNGEDSTFKYPDLVAVIRKEKTILFWMVK